ncbi:MAG: NADPH-dependent 7-cyano-7-deazaguanine reductase QueF [Candidatus Solibacter sp.]|nr:NADPH-dependent 7-cyano-7-deazaguanine reductase QueF [Candidatus Solibacter sp.]
MARKQQKIYTDEHASAGLNAELPAIETWPNQFRDDYDIEIETPEFTSVCPRTGLPDHGAITIVYTPDRDCLELKALKMYLLGYRNLGIFQENIVNRVLRDCVKACKPRRMTVTGEFTPRGGVYSSISASYSKKR